MISNKQVKKGRAITDSTREERMKERERKKARIDEQYDSDDVRFFEGM